MAFILGATTLKDPVKFTPKIIEISNTNVSLTGRTTKDVRLRKNQWTLEFQNLTPAQFTALETEFNALTTKDFQVTEANLTIAATPVHIDIPGYEYLKGGDYRTSLTVILTEET